MVFRFFSCQTILSYGVDIYYGYTMQVSLYPPVYLLELRPCPLSSVGSFGAFVIGHLSVSFQLSPILVRPIPYPIVGVSDIHVLNLIETKSFLSTYLWLETNFSFRLSWVSERPLRLLASLITFFLQLGL